MRALVANRNFRLLFVGMAASMIGDSMLMLVLAIWVNQLTGSASAAGLTLLALAAPTLLAPVAGWLVDRLPRRRFLFAANLASAAIMLPLLAVHGRGQLWLLIAVTVAYGASFVFVDPAQTGVIKHLVPADQLGAANGMLQTVKQGLRLLGPLAGAGIYVALGGPVVAMINAGTFVVAAAAVLLLKLGMPPVAADTGTAVEQAAPEADAEAPGALLHEITAGFRYVLHDLLLRRLTIGLLAAIFALEFVESGIFALVGDVMHRSTTLIGVITCTQGAGAVVGGVLAARLMRRFGGMPTLAAGVLLTALGIAALGTARLAVVFPAATVFGFGFTLLLVAANTLIQQRSPHRYIGRISAAADGIISVGQVTALALGAGLVTILDARLIMVLIGLGLAGSAVYLWRSRHAATTAAPEPEPQPVVTAP
ncbi:MFS transporter [Actinocatenispora comari]|uniref:MFS transporter n=1 Tax=Actinocatenispora comari TaxID=2807577 RepID=A0A8J4ELY4_9ACTN|nr:MFS transporter [Actinocatenispora comari]GIL28283.1 MFS transporter [Actinocatenispora comari]